MSTEAQTLLERVLSLPPTERAQIADHLLSSLDQPDPAIDSAWISEAEARSRAVDEGRAKTYTNDEVFSELDRE
jgi:putative addiction module component (TIGR02574 family)